MVDNKTSIDTKVPKTKKVPKPNEQWLDRRTSVDDLLGIMAELLIEGNATQQQVYNQLLNVVETIKTNEKIDTINSITEDSKDKEIKPGDTGVSLSVCNSGDIGSFIINKTILNAIAKSDIVAYERVIVVPGGTSDEPYIVPLSVLIKGSKGVIAQDENNYLISVMEANYAGSLVTVSSDAEGLMQTNVSKSEKISIIETDKDVKFTGTISQYDHETENLTGLTDNRIFVRGVNIQADQNLKFRLIFWTKDTFANTDLDEDSYIDDVILDMSDTENTFRINNTGQYYLNVSDLNILYEDKDTTNELHISLQNLSTTDKATGVTGEVQLDIKYAPRL